MPTAKKKTTTKPNVKEATSNAYEPKKISVSVLQLNNKVYCYLKRMHTSQLVSDPERRKILYVPQEFSIHVITKRANNKIEKLVIPFLNATYMKLEE